MPETSPVVPEKSKSKEIATSNVPAAPASSPQASIDSLPPWEIDFRNLKDPKEREKVELVMTKWTDGLRKDLAELLAKNGITVFELGFVHPGSKGTMLIANGGIFDTAKVAVAVTRELRGRVAEQLAIDQG
jgi:hypothetical protein